MHEFWAVVIISFEPPTTLKTFCLLWKDLVIRTFMKVSLFGWQHSFIAKILLKTLFTINVF